MLKWRFRAGVWFCAAGFVPCLSSDLRAQDHDWFVGGGCVVEAPDGSRDRPFPNIQAAVGHDAVRAGDTVVVLPGSYGRTTVNKAGIRIAAEAGPLETVCAGFNVTQAGVGIEGFTVTYSQNDANGIDVAAGATLTLRNCIVARCARAGISVAPETHEGSRLVVSNCVIYGNDQQGILLRHVETCCSPIWIPTTTVENSIIWENRGGGIILTRCPSRGFVHATHSYVESYSCNEGCGSGRVTGCALLTVPPVFCDADTGDFRLERGVNDLYWHAGLCGKAHLNPDGTRNTIGAFGGIRAEGFYDPPTGRGPAVERVIIEPIGGGRVQVSVQVRE
jgi:hypothetical protein